MRVDAIISTYDRLESLKVCIKSILECDYKDVSILVMVDGNKKILDAVKAEPVTTFFNPERKDYVISMNTLLTHSEGDAVLYGSDDLKFTTDCISKAVVALQKHFPDGDGLIGLNSYEATPPSAFGLMGKKFIDRFPGRQVFCPDYFHYAGDTELGEFAQKIGRFYFAEGAILKHTKRLSDSTIKLAQSVKWRDESTKIRRRTRHLCWGKSFKLIGRG